MVFLLPGVSSRRFTFLPHYSPQAMAHDLPAPRCGSIIGGAAGMRHHPRPVHHAVDVCVRSMPLLSVYAQIGNYLFSGLSMYPRHFPPTS